MERALWREYSGFARDSAAAFLIMALYWYGNDRSQKTLWQQAKDIYQARLPESLSDFRAYLAVVSGVLAPADRLLGFNIDQPHSEDFFRGLAGADANSQIKAYSKTTPDGACIPRLRCSFSIELAFLPEPQSGSLTDAVRIRFAKHQKTDSLGDVLNPRLVVSPSQLRLIKSFDGVRSLKQIEADLASSSGADADGIHREAAVLIRYLLLWNVLEMLDGSRVGRAEISSSSSISNRPKGVQSA